jgi:cytosine/adenosine deaminase-related metal-dependent hydrolase
LHFYKSHLATSNKITLPTLNTLLNSMHTPLVMPCITPRFVPTCSSDMMAELGWLANVYGLPVQSHMSESQGEIEWVKSLHPDCPTYAAVYAQHGLLGPYTYMAHCCHSSDQERQLLKEAQASAVHCASSNFMLSSGIMDVRQFVDEGIKVAIGTDVAGGYSPSMLDALRQTVIASRAKGFENQQRQWLEVQQRQRLHQQKLQQQRQRAQAKEEEVTAEGGETTTAATDNSSLESEEDFIITTASEVAEVEAALAIPAYASLSYSEAFHLCTVGGAEVLGMDKVVGNFMVGKKVDALIIDVLAPDSPIDTFGDETTSELFQKFLFLGDDRNIMAVYVDGRQVLG